MAASLTVARVRGIPIRLHATFLLALPLFAYLMASAYFAAPGGRLDGASWTWGALLAVGLFASVLLHEISHSLTALRFGVAVRDITLLPVGGVSAFKRMPREPRAEFWITLVGPLTNFVLAAPLLLVWWLGLVPETPVGFPTFVEWLGWTNLSLGVFNLFLPAFPMDGGRILRAILARRMGLARATHVAAGIGRAVALGLGLFGLLAGNFLVVLVAIFVFSGAGAEEHATLLTEALAPFTAGALAVRLDPLAPDATVDAAIARMRAERRLALPVARDGLPLGLARLEALAKVPVEARAVTIVARVMSNPVALAESTPAGQAAEAISESRSPIFVVDADGRMVGMLGGDEIERAAAVEEAIAAGERRVKRW